jgi:hypothetical protein
MGINFFFTFPTSEGSDLLSSHVMQTPTFISKLSDGNVIFRLDVGKNTITALRSFINKFEKKITFKYLGRTFISILTNWFCYLLIDCAMVVNINIKKGPTLQKVM